MTLYGASHLPAHLGLYLPTGDEKLLSFSLRIQPRTHTNLDSKQKIIQRGKAKKEKKKKETSPKYIAMVPRVLCNEESTVQLGGLKPVQHPTRLSGSLVWDGADLQETDYTYELTTADIREIEGALDIFKSEWPNEPEYPILIMI